MNLKKGIEEMLDDAKEEKVEVEEDDGEEKVEEKEEVEEKVEEEKHEEPKKSYEEHIDKLESDEKEAIDSYDKAIEELGDDEIVEELKRVRDDEIAHLEFLKRAKENRKARFEEPKEE